MDDHAFRYEHCDVPAELTLGDYRRGKGAASAPGRAPRTSRRRRPVIRRPRMRRPVFTRAR